MANNEVTTSAATSTTITTTTATTTTTAAGGNEIAQVLVEDASPSNTELQAQITSLAASISLLSAQIASLAALSQPLVQQQLTPPMVLQVSAPLAQPVTTEQYHSSLDKVNFERPCDASPCPLGFLPPNCSSNTVEINSVTPTTKQLRPRKAKTWKKMRMKPLKIPEKLGRSIYIGLSALGVGNFKVVDELRLRGELLRTQCNLLAGAHKVFDRKPDPGAEVNLGVKMKAVNVEVSGSVFKRWVTVFEVEKDLKAELLTDEEKAPQVFDEMPDPENDVFNENSTQLEQLWERKTPSTNSPLCCGSLPSQRAKMGMSTYYVLDDNGYSIAHGLSKLHGRGKGSYHIVGDAAIYLYFIDSQHQEWELKKRLDELGNKVAIVFDHSKHATLTNAEETKVHLNAKLIIASTLFGVVFILGSGESRAFGGRMSLEDLFTAVAELHDRVGFHLHFIGEVRKVSERVTTKAGGSMHQLKSQVKKFCWGMLSTKIAEFYMKWEASNEISDLRAYNLLMFWDSNEATVPRKKAAIIRVSKLPFYDDEINRRLVAIAVEIIGLENAFDTLQSNQILTVVLTIPSIYLKVQLVCYINDKVAGDLSINFVQLTIRMVKLVLVKHMSILSILSACARVEKVSEGLDLFGSMVNNYGISPRMEHYACLIDLFSRASQLEKACKMIQEMPFEADLGIWGALLAASSVHSNIKIGELAAKNMLDLDPQNSGPYVILSNIYVATGKWNDVATMRSLMEEHGVKKQQAYSWTEIGSKVHNFFGGDISHPDVDKICLVPKKINLHIATAPPKLGKDEILLLTNELCEELQSLGKPKEAAKFALEYCGEINNGVSLLITARDWEEALRIALLHTRQDLVTEVKDAALECAVLLIGEFEEGLENYAYNMRNTINDEKFASKLDTTDKITGEKNKVTKLEGKLDFKGDEM